AEPSPAPPARAEDVSTGIPSAAAAARILSLGGRSPRTTDVTYWRETPACCARSLTRTRGVRNSLSVSVVRKRSAMVIVHAEVTMDRRDLTSRRVHAMLVFGMQGEVAYRQLVLS